MKRRNFLRATALAAGALSAAQLEAANDIAKQWNSKKKSGFTLWQIPSHRNTIGNSYVMRTSKGKVIVMDGGFPQEELTLRGFIGALGNQVDAWFIAGSRTKGRTAKRKVGARVLHAPAKSEGHPSL